MTDLLSTTAAPPAAPRTQPILGIPLALTDYERTLDWVDATVESGGRGYICVAAVHTVMACQEDPELLEAVLGSDFTVPDGQPLVWALNMLGHRLRDRVYGPDLMELACERAQRTGRRMFLYGGRDSDPTALPRLEAVLLERFPGLQIAGTLQAKFIAAQRRGVRRGGRGHQRVGGRDRVGRAGRPAPGEVDGADA